MYQEHHIHVIESSLAELLLQQPCWREYDLIRALQDEPYQVLPNGVLGDELSLFQTHFIVFHCLYRLRQRWRQQQLWDLDIQTLSIERRVLPSHTPQLSQEPEALQTQDPLAAYYLDWNQLSDMDRDGVEQLLGAFWRAVAVPSSPPEKLERARQVLAISDSECQSESQLRRCYRRAMHRAHPDKGGTDDAAKAVENAYRVLLMELPQKL